MISMTLPQYRRHECTVDGRRIRLWSTWTEGLAVLLVSDPSGFVSRSTLIEAMWPDPDMEPDYAHTMVDRFVHELRRRGVTIENASGFGWRIPRWAREQQALQVAA